jgi:GTP pyrophosphokinase
MAIKKRLKQIETDDKTDRAFSLLIGAYDYLNKPISFDRYREEILKYFGLEEEKMLFDKIYSGEITTDNILAFTRSMTKEAGLKKFAHWIEGQKGRHKMLIDTFKNSNTIRPGVCCNPIPGDRIIGYRTTGDRGISIHRENCENAFIFASDEERVIYCTWAQSGDFGIFSQELTILGIDRDNIFSDITGVLESKSVKSESLDFRKGHGVIKLLMTVSVKTVDELNSIMKELKRVRGISSVHRNLPVKRIY